MGCAPSWSALGLPVGPMVEVVDRVPLGHHSGFVARRLANIGVVAAGRVPGGHDSGGRVPLDHVFVAQRCGCAVGVHPGNESGMTPV